MGWEDGLAILTASSKNTSWTGWQKNQSAQLARNIASTQRYDPFRAAPSALRVPRATVATLNPKYKPAEFPEKIEFSVPWSTGSAKPATPTKNTQGDFFASLGASFENAVGDGGYLNLMNAIPWGMERGAVLAERAVADLSGDDENLVSQALDFVGEGLGAVAGVIAPVLDVIPNLVRDTHLNSRAMAFKALTTGQSIGPLEAIVANALMMVGLNESKYALMGQSAGQLDASTRAVLAASIDLPESVKRGIAGNPDADVGKLFDAAPEGRMYSYIPGVEGAATNIGSNLIVYGSLIALTFGVSGTAMAAARGGAAPGALGGAFGNAFAAAPAVGQAIVRAAPAVRIATQIQKAALASGMGWFGLSTLTDAVGRTFGNQAVVDWFDKVNRSEIISDDPNIQIVTGFTVDPFRAANLARKGTLAIAKGTVNVPVNAIVGKRFARLYTSDTLIRDTVARMFATTREGAEKYVGPSGAYESWQEATDRVIELAWDHVATTLPERERIILGAIGDGRVRTQTVLAKYAGRIIDTIENHPESIVARLRRDWEYRDAVGEWDADVAAIIERDYLLAKKMTETARQKADAVVGFVEFLNPEGQRLFLQDVDDLFARGTATVRDLNTLNAKYPAIRSLYRDLVAGKTKSTDEITRDVFDTIAQRAADAYSSATHRNPVRVATGIDPILRPGSVRRVDDYAEALGTSRETIEAIETLPKAGDTAQRDLLSAFAKEKGIAGDAELAAMSLDDLWGKVNDFVDETTRPWVKRGEAVEQIEGQFARVSDRITELEDAIVRARKDGDNDAVASLRSELNRVHAERGRYYNLLSDVREPEVAFAENVRFGVRASVDDAMVERAKTKLAAVEAIENINRIDDEIDGWNTIGAPEVTTTRTVRKGPASTAEDAATRRAENKMRPAVQRTTTRRLSPLDMLRRTRNGNWGWAGTAPAMSDSLYAKLADFLHNYGGARGQRLAASMSEMGDEELWRLMAQHKDAIQLQRSLTGAQRRTVANATRYAKSTVDEYKDAWARRLEGGAAKSDDDFLDYLGRLKDERDEWLSGRPEYVVRRSAAADIPQWALDEADAGGRPDLYYDPEMAVAGESAQQRLARALESDDTFPAVRDIVRSDPLLKARAERLVPDQTPAARERAAKPMSPEWAQARIDRLRELGGLPEQEFNVPRRSGGGHLIVGRDVRRPGKWMVGFVDDKLEPTGHIEADTFADAIKEASYGANLDDIERALRGTDLPPSADEALDAFLSDPANKAAIGSLVGDLGDGPLVPGVPRARTDLDQAILSGDVGALDALRTEMNALRGQINPPLTNVPRDAAIEIASKPRLSVQLSAKMRDAGVGWHDEVPYEMWQRFDVGAKVASMILHGDLVHPPRTAQALLRVLKNIENGNAENIGIGVELAAEAQRASRAILDHMVGDAKKSLFEAGVLGLGRGLNPYTMVDDTLEMIADLFGKKGQKAGIVVRDDALGIQYGLKQRPSKAVVLEMSAVPGLAEELLTGHFQPFNERIFGAQVRQQFNHIFRGHHNQEIAFAARGRFVDRLAQDGVPADLASRIWRRWKERAVESRGFTEEKIDGKYRTRPSDNALYASERNIPNDELNALARQEARAYFKGGAGADVVETINFAEHFRLSTSFTRRQLEKLPLGDALQAMYGKVAHNKGVTTLYYIFRFGLDLRFHALNWLEGPALYAGRSLLRRDAGRLIEADEGLFGMTRQAIESFAKDGLHDTGYPFSHSRAAWAYRTFLKEQPDALRAMASEDPRLMQEAIEALAKYDPELSATIKAMGDNTDSYLKALDKHYRKIMESAEPEALIRKEVMQEAVGDPVLAELYGRIADVNDELWSNVRATFFGNPARSQVERVLNSYLLYWPISYQIKATKWLARIMFDRAGGLKTNAGGAVALDRLAQYHQELLETDPEYREFFDQHPTLVFAAQMLFPMTPGSIGVSLSPLTRDLFFGASKQIANVGPIYTFTKLLPDLTGELYQDFGSVPGVGDALGFTYRAIAGRQPPELD